MRMRGCVWACAAALAVAALGGGCRRQAAPAALAMVNGEPITAEEVRAERVSRSLGLSATAEVSEAALLEQMVDERLMLQRARALGLKPPKEQLDALETEARGGQDAQAWKAALARRGTTPEALRGSLERRWLVDAVVEREVTRKVPVTAQEIRDYYWEHLAEFRRGERRRVLMIACKERGDAEKALQEFRLGESFREVAKRYSQGAEASQGGDLGLIGFGDLPKALAKLAFSQAKDRATGVVKSAYGYHILMPVEIQKPVNLSLEEASGRIAQKIRAAKSQEYWQAWLYGLRQSAALSRPAQGGEHESKSL